MTNENKPTRDENLIKRLEGFVEEENRAALANLRRGLGKSFAEAPEVFPYVMPFAKSYEEETFGLIAALFALHQGSWHGEGDGRYKRNLGASLWRYKENLRKQNIDDKSTEKRFVALLNANREDLPEYLRQIVSLLKSKDVFIDWLVLLRDIKFWDYEPKLGEEWREREVQKRWARSFWRGTDDENLNSNKNSENQNPEEEN